MLPKVDVECNVENCTHNKNGECIASIITICEGNCMTIEEKEKRTE